MNNKEKDKLLKDALNKRGIGFFNHKMVEEMAELTQVLCKWENCLNGGDDDLKELRDKIQEELGHVLAFSEILKLVFDNSKITHEKDKRIERFKKYC